MLIGAARIVALAALGAAGLAGDGVGVAGQRRDGLGHPQHPFPDQVEGLALVLNDIHDLRLGLFQRLAGVGVEDGLDEVGAVAGAAVGQRGGIGRQLDGRDRRVALADGSLHVQRLGVVGVVLGGQAAQRLADLHAGALAQAQLVGIGVVDITGQAPAHIVEEDVAAPLDGGHDVDVAAVAMAGAFGVVILIIGIDAIAQHRGIPVDQPRIQRRHRHAGLVGGAGGIQALQRAVEQGHVLILAVCAVIGGIEVLVKAGVIGRCQHTAGLDVDDDDRTGTGLLAVRIAVPDPLHVLCQRLIDGFLELAVDGQLDGVARFRHGGQGRVHDDAVRVAGDGLHAILAAQLVLIGRFQTGNADDVVHVVAFFLERIGHLTVLVGHLPLFGCDFAHPAQHMGQNGALLVAAGARLHDLHARQGEAVLFDGGHGGLADVFRQNEVVDVGKRLQLHLVVDAAQDALPVEGEIRKFIVLHQLFHHIVGGGVLLQAEVLLHGGKGALLGGVVALRRVRIVPGGIRLPDEQAVVPALAVLAQQADQLLEQGVQIFVAHQQLVQHHVVARHAGSDALALAVHDVAAGRRDGKFIVGRVGGLLLEAVAVDQLQEDQPEAVQPDDHTCGGNEEHHPPHGRFAFVLVHPFSFWRSRFRLRRCRS